MKININVVSLTLLIVGVIFLLIGYYRGEADMVWQKSVLICLECIGIG